MHRDRSGTASGAARLISPPLTIGMFLLLGCGRGDRGDDSFTRLARELDGIVAESTPAGEDRIRTLLSHDRADVRALAAQAAGAAGHWDRVPDLVAMIDDPDRVVRGRSAAAIATLVGRDHGFDPDASPEVRAEYRRRVVACYEELRANPPPKYRP